MIKTLHTLSRVLTRVGEYLWEAGGSLELWCDERAYRKRWTAWAKHNDVAIKGWVAVPMPDFDPADFAIPSPDTVGTPSPSPRPLVFLDAYTNEEA